MNLLIIGGTQFVGRHLIEAALAGGHDVTLFNRGRTNPGLYPDVKEIHGDRDGGLAPLQGHEWDVVVDCCGYVPRVVRDSAELLRDAVGHYVFVSSMSVYTNYEATSEGDPVHELEDPTTEDVLPNYGGLKVACERVVTEVYGERGLNVRPGLIVGPYDTVARLPHLLKRYDKDGERLAGRPEQPVQLIHARDLGEWMLQAVEKKLSGEYNLTGHPVTMRELLETIVTATGKGVEIVYTSDAFLQEHEVQPIDGLTYWIPAEFEAFMQAPIDRALNTGLKLRPLKDTIEQTLAWIRNAQIQQDELTERLMGTLISDEREAELLALWQAQAGN